MSCRRSPPAKPLHSLQKPRIANQESDTASDCLGSDPDQGNQSTISRRQKRKHSDTTRCEIKDMLAAVQLEQKLQAIKFEEEMNKMLHQNKEMMQSIQHMSDKYDEVLKQLQQSKAENVAFKNHIKFLEQKLEFLDRNSKSSSLELRNIPANQPETRTTLTNTIRTIGDVLKIDIQNTDIRNIYRPKKISGNISPILVEFSSSLMKEEIIKATKIFNKQNKEKINTMHLKLGGVPQPIFISEVLTTRARRLYFLAREYVKNHKHASCWTSYGKVYIRKTEGEPPKLISTEEDIPKVTNL
ncbi:unnamed protein product [Arctia plantaginis]|uniref:FP protein C-terminal domain-containing protein n=1 Tax=Arctia plantaginis TaxID=874455 RepID=A0A8S1B308_ARCPL|nr:unnamed protein product [Arctia plantaginis]